MKGRDMGIKVTRETAEEIKAMGCLGKIVERCTDCHLPTRYWANDGEYPLCETCADRRPDAAT